MEEVKKGKYLHYKGGKYEVIDVVIHSETLEKMVLYKALYDSKEFGNNSLWVRPLDMFLGEVEIDGENVKRFKYIS